MFTSIAFYIGEKVLGLNDREYPLGELTAEVLNISPEEYHELQRMLDKAMESMDCYEEKHQMQDWFDANEEIIRLHEALIQHRIFRLLQDKPEVLYEARALTEQYTLFPEDGDTLMPGELDLSILDAIADYEDYLEHPELVEAMIPVVLDAKAEKAYRDFERNLLVEIDDEILDAGSAAVLSGKLLQMANGAVYNEERQPVEVHDCKLEVFLETTEKLNGAHALVFYNFQHDLSRILKVTKRSGLAVRQLKTPRDAEDWNAGKVDLLLAHPASAAYGLNLQEGGNHVIWFGLNWSLELYQQANKRLHRQGQKSTVFVHHLVTQGTRDEDVLEALHQKGDTQEHLLQSLKARIEQIKKR